MWRRCNTSVGTSAEQSRFERAPILRPPPSATANANRTAHRPWRNATRTDCAGAQPVQASCAGYLALSQDTARVLLAGQPVSVFRVRSTSSAVPVTRRAAVGAAVDPALFRRVSRGEEIVAFHHPGRLAVGAFFLCCSRCLGGCLFPVSFGCGLAALLLVGPDLHPDLRRCDNRAAVPGFYSVLSPLQPEDVAPRHPIVGGYWIRVS